jgi:SAM-dependent methyltransferase
LNDAAINVALSALPVSHFRRRSFQRAVKLMVSAISRRPLFEDRAHRSMGRAIATAYNQSGDNYLSYADGDPSRLFAFDGQYAYGDRCIWEILNLKLCELRDRGALSVRILDLGCGPGTWIRRTVTQARKLGFTSIIARGVDIADEQVRRARALSAELASLQGVNISFEVGDILKPLPEPDASVDFCLCLCGVLNHIPRAKLSAALAEFGRVTRGCFLTSVRAIGSTPTVYVEGIEQALRFRQDHQAERLDVEFPKGRLISVYSHLFSAAELESLVAPYIAIEDLRGLDLFHGRFARDPRWNPPNVEFAELFVDKLDQLEQLYCRQSEFIDHATHLLLVGRNRRTCATAAVCSD